MNLQRLANIAGVTLTESTKQQPNTAVQEGAATADITNLGAVLHGLMGANTAADTLRKVLSDTGYDVDSPADESFDDVSMKSVEIKIVMQTSFYDDHTETQEVGNVYVTYKNGQWTAEY